MQKNLATQENSRLVAADLLRQYALRAAMPARLLESQTVHRAFVHEMVLGVVRQELALQWLLERLARRKVASGLAPVCWVGLYQLLMMDDVEPYAAVNETVEATKLLCGDAQAGFVNAILRRALREKDELLHALSKQPPEIRLSHPRSLIRRWTATFGRAGMERLCEWNNQRAHTILRVRPGHDARALLELFAQNGIPAELHPRRPFIELKAGGRVEICPGYSEGWFVIQDPATMEAVRLVDPKPNEQILDACAAPGGKTIALADAMKGGNLVATDFNRERLPRLIENLKRCGVKADVRCLDASSPDFGTQMKKRFDAVLLDVPCSNTGVIRRRPDARYRVNRKHLKHLLDLQSRMLDATMPLIKKGGRIVYSTCSLEPEENEAQIDALLKRHPNFSKEKEVRTFPPDDQVDGAYVARLVLLG